MNRKLLAALCVALAMVGALVACGRLRAHRASFAPAPPAPIAGRQASPNAPGQEAAADVTVSYPNPQGVQIGGVVDVTVTVDGRTDFFQMAGRLVFDETAYRPVGVSRGDFLGSDAVFFTKLDQVGFVPFALTRLAGQPSTPEGGRVLTVTFRKLAEPKEKSFRFRLVPEEHFLILRDPTGKMIRTTASVEVR
jgi:hypothetical protein